VSCATSSQTYAAAGLGNTAHPNAVVQGITSTHSLYNSRREVVLNNRRESKDVLKCGRQVTR
jgi:hypothetical protein